MQNQLIKWLLAIPTGILAILQPNLPVLGSQYTYEVYLDN